MRVFASKAFRRSGVDYPYGYQDVPQALADTLIAAGLVTDPNTSPPSSTTRTLSGDYTLTAGDDGVTFYASVALNFNIPDGLVPRPSFIIDCPPTGNVTIQRSGSVVLLNGAASALPRGRTNNPAGVAVMAHQDADSYGVAGS